MSIDPKTPLTQLAPLGAKCNPGNLALLKELCSKSPARSHKHLAPNGAKKGRAFPHIRRQRREH
jgi:hypothetical protein